MAKRVERLRAKLAKLEEDRRVALRRCDVILVSRIAEQIESVKKELEEARMYEPRKLNECISRDEMLRDDIYRKLLKVSLAADFCNNCIEEVKSALRKHGLNDFSFRRDVDDLCKLSQKIASLVIIPGQSVLTDMLTDNDEFIDTCDEAADRHLAQKLKL